MSIKAVLFDLDGTLLPMDLNVFVKAYLGLLAKKLATFGYEPEMVINAIWKGTAAMTVNNGEKTNEEVFWDTFSNIFGEKVRDDEPIFEEFYKNEFQNVREVCGFNENAVNIVCKLKENNIPVVLATSPLFPAIATESRIKWAGLTPQHFKLYTTYENCKYCKPNIKYYEDVAQRIGFEPKECLMVGNDVGDDMVATESGMQVFLLTDNLINKENVDISKYPCGGFEELEKYLKLEKLI